MPVIEAIILCGRQDLVLREQWDYGKINVDLTQISNDGNFQELLKYRGRGDSQLKIFLEGSGKRNKYIHKTI